jgi:hypothetical protein
MTMPTSNLPPSQQFSDLPTSPGQDQAPTPFRKPVHKTYTSAKDAKANTPFIFEIDGKSFEALPGRVPGVTQIDFSGLTVTRNPESMWDYFRAAFSNDIDPTKFDEFEAYLKDPVRDVTIELLMEVVKDMIEFGNGLPTLRSNS